MGGVVMHCFLRPLKPWRKRVRQLAAPADEKGLPACVFSDLPVKVSFTTTFVIPEMLCVR